MRLSQYRLSFALTVPIGLVLGLIGGAVFTYLGGRVDAAGGWINPVLLGIGVIVGGVFGVAHGAAGLGGGLVGAVVASTCRTPMRSRVIPAIVGSAVANIIGWATASLVLWLTVWSGPSVRFVPTSFIGTAAICILVSAAVAGLLVAIDERYTGARAIAAPV